MSDIEVIGVVGAGQMGAGIAHVAALSGFKVLLADADRARADKGKAGVQKRMARAVEKGKLEASAMEAALEAITPVDGSSAADRDAVVPALVVSERSARSICSSERSKNAAA